jgi:hypothetical protein
VGSRVGAVIAPAAARAASRSQQVGSWGNAVASAIYLVLLLIELFWWPKRRERLLTNTQRAAAIAAPPA